MDWETIITGSLVSDIVPPGVFQLPRSAEEGARLFFLEGLAEARQSEILKAQLALSHHATAPERIYVLARNCPALHKLGQTLARDDRISTELRRHLQQLESLPSSLPSEHIQDALAGELGLRARIDVELLPALAEASVAVVVPFRMNADGSEGVFKILKPRIKERLEEELQVLERTGAYLDERIEELGIPSLSYRDTFEQVRSKLLCEVRPDLEQNNLSAARDIYSDTCRVLIPALIPEYCSPRVTAMERVHGRKITAPDPDGKWGRSGLAELVVSELIARPLLSRSGRDVFHGDPHAGNLFITNDGRLAILDWSLIGAISEEEHIAFTAVLVGAMTGRPQQIENALRQLSRSRDFERGALDKVIGAALHEIKQGRRPGLTWMTSMLDDAVQAGVRFGPDLLLLRRVIHILNGLIADMAGRAGFIDEVVIQRFLNSFVLEWPFRWLAPPHSRQFPTRLSNIDIAGLMFDLLWSPARFWLGRSN